ncbi:MAG: efflux RND transporter permease subunit, partial [Deferribacterota bacterium]|nr:efflux RND transporter permease subunit [Deferribacterota bacterium]
KNVLDNVTNILLNIKGVDDVLAVSGFSLLSGQAENVGFAIASLEPWDERKSSDQHIKSIIDKSINKFKPILAANIFPFMPPPIQGLGTTSGFDFRLEALEDQPPQEIASVARGLIVEASQKPQLFNVFTTYTADTPQLFLNLDRIKIEQYGVPVGKLFATLGQHLGSYYVNDFNLYGRTYQVKIMSDEEYRNTTEDIMNLYVDNRYGNKVPMESLIDFKKIIGPQTINRYNLFSSVTINGEAASGYASGEAMDAMEKIANEKLPSGYSYEWSSTSYQEKKAGGTVVFLFILAIVFAYLFLVGQYESWNLPLSVMLSVLIASFGALLGLLIAGLSLSLYAQIGVVLLVGLASKNAILIVEFAKDSKEEGMSTFDAAVEGAKIRFRPVLMTALTFIIGVAPLVVATGAGAGSRRDIGTTVFSGMTVATTLGILIIPCLYYIFQNLRDKGHAIREKREKKQKSDNDKND